MLLGDIMDKIRLADANDAMLPQYFDEELSKILNVKLNEARLNVADGAHKRALLRVITINNSASLLGKSCLKKDLRGTLSQHLFNCNDCSDATETMTDLANDLTMLEKCAEISQAKVISRPPSYKQVDLIIPESAPLLRRNAMGQYYETPNNNYATSHVDSDIDTATKVYSHSVYNYLSSFIPPH